MEPSFLVWKLAFQTNGRTDASKNPTHFTTKTQKSMESYKSRMTNLIDHSFWEKYTDNRGSNLPSNRAAKELLLLYIWSGIRTLGEKRSNEHFLLICFHRFWFFKFVFCQSQIHLKKKDGIEISSILQDQKLRKATKSTFDFIVKGDKNECFFFCFCFFFFFCKQKKTTQSHGKGDENSQIIKFGMILRYKYGLNPTEIWEWNARIKSSLS